MGFFSSKDQVRALLQLADIELNGDRPWDIVVERSEFYHRVMAKGSMGLGESYIDGWWQCSALDEFANRLIRANIREKVGRNLGMLVSSLSARLLNLQSRTRSHIVGKAHYDIGNSLFKQMLGRRMIYSCGYWKDASDLDRAQEAKLELICRKLRLEPGMKVLDIGCGWGGFAIYAAERYSVEVVGATISEKQYILGQKLAKGLPVAIQLRDYRDLVGTFDRIVSIGMFEHVGYKNHRTFMNVMSRCLSDNGIALLHTICSNRTQYISDPWIRKYIFPHSAIPSLALISKAIEGLFVIEDVHNIGPDYEPTLLAWYKNFTESWQELEPLYGERFRRMWSYWLLTSAGTFRARSHQVLQLAMTKTGAQHPLSCRTEYKLPAASRNGKIQG